MGVGQRSPVEGDYGILPGVDEIYPRMSGAQIDAMDNLYYSTLQRHNGRTGIYITEARLWGNFPQLGVPGTDYSGTGAAPYHRRRLPRGTGRGWCRASTPISRRRNGTHSAGCRRRPGGQRRAPAARGWSPPVRSLIRLWFFSGRCGRYPEHRGIAFRGFDPAARQGAAHFRYHCIQPWRRRTGDCIMATVNGRGRRVRLHWSCRWRALLSRTLEDASYGAGREVQVHHATNGSPLDYSLGAYKDKAFRSHFC